jgi:hypothetical protein
MGRRQDGFLSSAGASVKKLTFRLASHRTKQNISIAGSIRVDWAFQLLEITIPDNLARPAIYGRVFYTTVFGDRFSSGFLYRLPDVVLSENHFRT